MIWRLPIYLYPSLWRRVAHGALNLLCLFLKISEGGSLQSLMNPLRQLTFIRGFPCHFNEAMQVAFNNTFPEKYFFPPQWPILFGNKISNLKFFQACRLCAGGRKKNNNNNKGTEDTIEFSLLVCVRFPLRSIFSVLILFYFF